MSICTNSNTILNGLRTNPGYTFLVPLQLFYLLTYLLLAPLVIGVDVVSAQDMMALIMVAVIADRRRMSAEGMSEVVVSSVPRWT